ncbi:MAG: ribosome silencing factor [Clostridia bacterium]|nr:ribosome silencing factor [Clostridia bacterium]
MIDLHSSNERVFRELPALGVARVAAACALEKKALDVVIMDLSSVSFMADYFVVCTVNTDTHARAVREEISERLEGVGLSPRKRDGSDSSGWIVMDWGDLIVHIFRGSERQFYDLEGLWGDAPRERVTDPGSDPA